MPLILTQQTRPVVTSAGSGVQLPPTTVPALSTVTIDIIPFTTLIAVKWFVTIYEGYKVRFLEVSASCNISQQPKHTVFGDVGSRINIKPDVTKQSGGITLSIINNEALPVQVTAVQLQAANI